MITEENKETVPTELRLSNGRPSSIPNAQVNAANEELCLAVRAQIAKMMEYCLVSFISGFIFIVLQVSFVDSLYLNFLLAIHCWTIYYILLLVRIVK